MEQVSLISGTFTQHYSLKHHNRWKRLNLKFEYELTNFFKNNFEFDLGHFLRVYTTKLIAFECGLM